MVTGFFSFDAYGFLRAFSLERSYSAFMSATLVERAFTLGCLASRDDSDGFPAFTFAVANDEQFGMNTHAQHEKAFFIGRVILIEELNSEFIIENGLCFFE